MDKPQKITVKYKNKLLLGECKQHLYELENSLYKNSDSLRLNFYNKINIRTVIYQSKKITSKYFVNMIKKNQK